MPLQDHELAHRDAGILTFRSEPVRVRWLLDGLQTADAQDLTCNFTASVHALPDKTERQMLAEVLLGDRTAVSREDIARHFLPSLRAAAEQTAQRFSAADSLAMDSPAQKALLEALRGAAKPVAFGCGVEILPPFNLELASDSYQQQRLRGMQQALVEQKKAGELEHLQRAAELLKQFDAIQRATPQLSAGRILDQINPSDQGSMLRTLLLASARRPGKEAGPIWVVAGHYLARVDPAAPAAPPELFELPTDLGPLRSVQAADVEGRPHLLVGAQRGFIALQTSQLSKPMLYRAAGIESSLGFNRVIYWGVEKGFCGTHGEAGVVRWEAGKEMQVAAARPELFGGEIRPASATGSSQSGSPGPRHVQLLDALRVVFSVGPRLFTWDGQTIQRIEGESSGEIAGIVPDFAGAIVVREDGAIDRLHREKLQIEPLQKRGTRLRAAGELPWLDGKRILLAADNGPLVCIGIDDRLVTEYVSPHRDLRVVSGSPANVAAVSSDRQRLILWNSWDGQKPVAEVYLIGLTRHRIADICFG